jgi:hypothetical protein
MDGRGYGMEKSTTTLCDREARLPELAPVDSALSRRSTVMSALHRAIGVIHAYQSDSSSKQPAPSYLSLPQRTPNENMKSIP